MNKLHLHEFTDEERDLISNRLCDVFSWDKNIGFSIANENIPPKLIFMDRKIIFVHNRNLVDIEFLSEVKDTKDVDLAFQLNLTKSIEKAKELTDDWRKSLYANDIDICQCYEKAILAIRLRNELPTNKPVKPNHKI